jgi:hypothetical protein
MPSGKRKRHKVAAQRKKRARANRHKEKSSFKLLFSFKVHEIEISNQSSALNYSVNCVQPGYKLIFPGYNTC